MISTRKARPDPNDIFPLYSTDAEQAVLASMLCHPELVMDEVALRVAASDFFVPAHQVLFRAFAHLFERHQAIDIVTVDQYLRDRKLADEVGSPAILAEIAANLVTHLNVSAHLQIVKDRSLLRSLQGACAAVLTDIERHPQEAAAVLDRAQAAILGVAGNVEDLQDELGSEFETVTLPGVLERQASPHRIVGIPSGFPKLDERLVMGNGNLIVVAARPGVGKSALMDQMREHQASLGYVAGVINIEMPNEENRLRTLSRRAGVPLAALRTGFPKLAAPDLERVKQAARALSQVVLPMNDNPTLTVERIRAIARRWKRKYRLDILYIDYLQLVQGSGQENRREEVSYISRGLKKLAKELGIPIVALAQLNRESVKENRLPRVSDLRDSGTIEQDADVIWLLHTDMNADEHGDLGVWPYKFIIGKQRNGPTFTQLFEFIRAQVKFQEAGRLR